MLRKTSQQFPLALPYLIAILITFPLFWPTWLRLFQEWLKWEQVLAHGLPTFVLFIGVVLLHPPLTSAETRGPSKAAGTLLFLLAVLWGLLELVRIDTLAYFMVPAGMLLTCWTLYGFQPALKFVPYVLLFSLSLPIWADLVPYLVDFASVVVGNLVSLLGITALIEGANITLPYGRLVIADGCSGIRYLATSLLLASMTAILNDYRWKGWVAALMLGVSLALLVNWIRITALVLIAYYTNMESSLVRDHEFFGWIVFAILIIPAFWLVPVLRRQQQAKIRIMRINKKGLLFLIPALLVGTVGISAVQSATTPSPVWQLKAPAHSAVSTEALPINVYPPSGMIHEVVQFEAGGWVSIAQSSRTSGEEKLVPYLVGVLETGDWFPVVDQNKQGITVYQNLANRNRVAVFQSFLVGSHEANSYRIAKLLQIPAILSGQNRFALLTFQANCLSRDCDEAKEQLMRLRHEKLLTSSR